MTAARRRPGSAMRLPMFWLSLQLLWLGGCAEQLIQRQAREQIVEDKWSQAVATLEDGVRRYPESAPLRSGLLQARSQAVARRVAAALAARAAGRLDEAQSDLEAARELERTNPRIDALLAEVATQRRQHAALEEAERQVAEQRIDAALHGIEQALKDNPRHAGLLALKQRLEAGQRPSQPMPGSLAEQRPISLDFRDAGLRTVLDMVTRHSGLNFVFDRDVRTDARVTVLLRNARLDDALDFLTSTQQLARKIVDPNTVLIYPNTPDKQREYQEQVVRVFYLASADAKGAAAFLRSMLRIRDPYVDERTNMLALRETPETIRMAERLVALYDAGEPEVLLEVEVLEVSASRLTELGVKFPDSVTLTPLPPVGSAGLTLANLGGINRERIGVGVSSLLLNLKREVGDFSTLAHPRIRARNREKAKILIGDRIPVITTTAGTGGFVSESVSYLEVGLKLDVEPTVHADDDVTIRIALEVSSLGTAVKTTTGTLAYQIGTRNAATLLRLHDGETQILAGLISRDERTSASRLPGLGDLPVLGRLFSNQLDQGQRTELMLAITPRILRNIRRPGADETELWVGTDAAPRLRRPSQAAQASRGAGAAVPEPRPASMQPATSDGQAVGAAAEPSAAAVLRPAWSGAGEVAVGDAVDVHLNLPAGVPLRGLPVDIGFDTRLLQFDQAIEGDLFSRDGTPTAFSQAVHAAAGRVQLGVMRKTATSATGPGRVLTLRFKALAAGSATVRLDSAQPIAMAVPAPAVAPAVWTLTVRARP